MEARTEAISLDVAVAYFLREVKISRHKQAISQLPSGRGDVPLRPGELGERQRRSFCGLVGMPSHALRRARRSRSRCHGSHRLSCSRAMSGKRSQHLRGDASHIDGEQGCLFERLSRAAAVHICYNPFIGREMYQCCVRIDSHTKLSRGLTLWRLSKVLCHSGAGIIGASETRIKDFFKS